MLPLRRITARQALAALLALAGCIVFLSVAVLPAHADVPFTLLHSFAGSDGSVPQSALSLAPSGNYYGATTLGGSASDGCVYEMAPGGSPFTVIHNFNDGTTPGDGLDPVGNLVVGSDGSVYGVTFYGGANAPNSTTGGGTIFKISPAGVYQILVSFPATGIINSYPPSSLTFGSDGLLYGTTAPDQGNASTLYSLSTTGANFTTLYPFNGGASGTGPQNPVGALTLGPNGVFYGVAMSGGTMGRGAIYTFTPGANGGVAVLHSFDDGTVSNDTGVFSSGVTVDTAGNVYGAASGGGAYSYGYLYEESANGIYSILHSFSPNQPTDGEDPESPPIIASDGNLYGTTTEGGTEGDGTVYCLTPAGYYEIIDDFLQFQGNPKTPAAQLVEDSSGDLLGTSESDKFLGYGTIYDLQTTLYSPLPLSLSLNPSTLFTPSYGNPPAQSTVTITLAAPAPASGTVVSLQASDQQHVSMPSSIVIASGQTTATFQLSCYSAVYSQETVAITAVDNYRPVSALLTLNPPPPVLWGVYFSSSTIPENTSLASNTVNLTTNVLAATTVSLSSSDPSALSVPSSVVVPVGSNSAPFTATAGTVSAPETVTVTATYNGVTQSQTILVTVPGPTVSSVTLSPTVVPQNTSNSTNTVALTGPATINSTVTLTSSNPSVASVPASVVIPVGASSATFTTTAGIVSGDPTTTITASYNGGSASATLTVQQAGISALTISPHTVPGGVTSISNTITFNTGPQTNAVITLTSSNPAVATVPSTVTMPAGATSLTFPITTYAVTSLQTVYIGAQYGNAGWSASLQVRPLSLSSLALGSSSVVGGATVSGNTVSIEAAVGAATTIALTSSNAAASVPTSVIIPAGSTSATFSIATTAVTTSQTTTIGATLNGYTMSLPLTVNPATAPALVGVSLSPTSTVGGTSTTANTVSLSSAATANTTIALSSSNAAVATVPTTVVIPAGSTSQTFTITTEAVTTSQTVTISAGYNGATQTAALTVTPPPPPPLSLAAVSTANSTIIGGTTTTSNYVNINNTSSTSTTVALSSSNPAIAAVPSSVVIPAGSANQSFAITTHPVTAWTSVTITGTLNGVTKTLALTIVPIGLKSVALSPISVQGGTAATTANRVYWTGNAPASETVYLYSSNTAVATVPTSVTISSGSSSHVFTITTKAVTSTQTVTITAVNNGTEVTATLTVTPPPAPVAGLKSVILSPTSTEGGASTTANRVYWNGNAPASETVTLKSSNTAVATVPSSVMISSGSSSHTFTVTTKAVTSTQTVTITASSGGVTQMATLTVTP